MSCALASSLQHALSNTAAGWLGNGELHHPAGRGLHRDRGGVGPRGSAVMRLGQVSTAPVLLGSGFCLIVLSVARCDVHKECVSQCLKSSGHPVLQVHSSNTHQAQALDADDLLRADDRGRRGCVQAVRMHLCVLTSGRC